MTYAMGASNRRDNTAVQRKSKMDVRGNKLSEYQLGVTTDPIRRDLRQQSRENDLAMLSSDYLCARICLEKIQRVRIFKSNER